MGEAKDCSFPIDGIFVSNIYTASPVGHVPDTHVLLILSSSAVAAFFFFCYIP